MRITRLWTKYTTAWCAGEIPIHFNTNSETMLEPIRTLHSDDLALSLTKCLVGLAHFVIAYHHQHPINLEHKLYNCPTSNRLEHNRVTGAVAADDIVCHNKVRAISILVGRCRLTLSNPR